MNTTTCESCAQPRRSARTWWMDGQRWVLCRSCAEFGKAEPVRRLCGLRRRASRLIASGAAGVVLVAAVLTIGRV